MNVSGLFLDENMYDDTMNKSRNFGLPARQTGVVLLIALVVLIAMTLSALALIKSVNTTNLVSGNLAFRESAVLYAERATEHAIVWLVSEANKPGHGELYRPNPPYSSWYLPVREDPNPASADAGKKSWDALWGGWRDDGKPRSVPIVGSGGADPTGNQVSFVIQRLCERPGDPMDAECSRPPHDGKGSSLVAGSSVAGLMNPQVYYRITARVGGSRNTVVYTQTMVAL
jgi:Tfp pilus assembly protein PilX